MDVPFAPGLDPYSPPPGSKSAPHDTENGDNSVVLPSKTIVLKEGD